MTHVRTAVLCTAMDERSWMEDLVAEVVEQVTGLSQLVTAAQRASAAEAESLAERVDALAREVEALRRTTRQELANRPPLAGDEIDTVATAIVQHLQASFRVVGPPDSAT